MANSSRHGRGRAARLVVAGLAALTCLSAAPGASARTWSANGDGAEITLTDCSDCGDDIGMLVACRGVSRPAEVTVHWAASDDGEDGASAPLAVEVDGARFSYPATTVYYGAIGYTPQFDLYPDDPLVEALQHGRRARFRFNGATAEIGLSGSRAAFQAFEAECPWRGTRALEPGPDAPDDVAPGDSGAGEGGAVWSFYRDEQSVGTLIFGVPETDDTTMALSCAQGSSVASIELFAAPALAGAGVPVVVTLAGPGGTHSLTALSNAQGRPVATVGAGDPVWSALAGPGAIAIAIAVAGQPAGRIDSLPENAADDFFAHCGWR